METCTQSNVTEHYSSQLPRTQALVIYRILTYFIFGVFFSIFVKSRTPYPPFVCVFLFIKFSPDFVGVEVPRPISFCSLFVFLSPYKIWKYICGDMRRTPLYQQKRKKSQRSFIEVHSLLCKLVILQS